MPTFDKNAEPPAYELLTGDYPFDIAWTEEKISRGPKTSGADVREITLDFYRDETFAEKVATVRDSLIDHKSCDWKFSVLAKCVGYPVQHGVAFDIDESWRGYRGWAHVAPEADKKDPSKFWNRVKVYLCDRKHISPRAMAAADDADNQAFGKPVPAPETETIDDDIPF